MMTEMVKTMVYAGVALGVLAVTFIARPRAVDHTPDEMVGKPLYEFDVDAPKRLKIVQFDESQSALSEFEVAQVRGEWSIPSKNGYPADADRQMSDAATSVNHLEVLRIASEKADNHEELGVVDPTSSLSAGAEGVGMHVSMIDGKGDTLIDLIIGDEIKDQEDQRYVRRANQAVTYVVKIDPTKLSTSFEDWIEKDLLKLSPWDISRIEIKDYQLERSLTLSGRIEARIDQRSEMTLSYNDKGSEWSADTIRTFDPVKKDFQPADLTEDEELDATKLNDLKTALDDLRIVDVERKPEGLSKDLKASEDFVTSNEAAESLFLRGFLPTQGRSGGLEILSTDGEVVCSMKNGVEYVLRFGDFQLAGSESLGALKTENSTDEGDDLKRDEIHRYLFVMARHNEDTIEKPALEDVPPLPDSAKEDAQSGGDNTEGDDAEEEPDVEDPEADNSTDDVAANADDADDADDNDDDDGEAVGDKGTVAADEATSDEKEASDSNKTEADESEHDGKTKLEKAIEDRKTIEEANKRKLDEYENKIKEGKKVVAELNERFGDWYYVIDNEVYQKIHLSRDEIVKKKEKEEGEEGDVVKPLVDAGGFGKPGEPIPGLPKVPASLQEESP